MDEGFPEMWECPDCGFLCDGEARRLNHRCFGVRDETLRSTLLELSRKDVWSAEDLRDLRDALKTLAEQQ